MTAAPILVMDHVSKSYGPAQRRTEVLRDVCLSIRAGEKVSLVGPSGSGKSTLLSLIAGLLRPDGGTIAFDGVVTNVRDDRARARLRADRIGIALQSGNLIPFLTARENIELAMAFGSVKRVATARARAVDLLERFGVAHRERHYPRQLSGGETQRVALAVAMVNKPSLLLADEVVAQLDAQTAARVVGEVLTADFAVLYVTHDPAIADLADRGYAIDGHTVSPR